MKTFRRALRPPVPLVGADGRFANGLYLHIAPVVLFIKEADNSILC
jgi:hypothetical protein